MKLRTPTPDDLHEYWDGLDLERDAGIVELDRLLRLYKGAGMSVLYDVIVYEKEFRAD